MALVRFSAIVTVFGSRTWIVAMSSYCFAWGCFVSGFRARSRTNFTSSAVSSRPPWKRTPFLRKNV